jgi:putative inorganic carbon (HCO3(-)) transporter
MKDFTVKIGNGYEDLTIYQKTKKWIHQKIVLERLLNWFGILTLLVLTVLTSVAIGMTGFEVSAALTILIVGIPLAFASLFNLRVGVVIAIVTSFFVLGVKRLAGDVQLGVLMDVLIVILFFGMFIKQINEKDWSFADNPISKIILIWICYNLFQGANPSSESTMAWLYTIRSAAGIMVFYFMLMYAINSKKFITILIYLWIGLVMLATIYGYIQEFAGLAPFEMRWVMETSERYALLYQAGKFKKFSFFSDPLVFGFTLAFTSMLCFVLATGPVSRFKKAMYVLMGIFMLYGMLFSSTRAAFILPVASLLFLTAITLNKKLLLFGLGAVFIGFVLLQIPSSNPELVRFQSAFSPTDDPSYQVRVRNQAFIQPYIQTHPFGGGMGATGEWGKKFSPWSPLANFPPDSGYIRTAVEMGWIGLFLQLLMIFIVLYVGIKDYFRIKDKLLKSYALGMLTVVYCLALANFPQEAIGQYPISLLFFVAIAIVNKCRQFDEASQQKIINKT